MVYSFDPDRYEYLRYGNTSDRDVPLPYDYEHKGVLNKVLPAAITNAKNATTQGILKYINDIAVFFLRYVRLLQHAKDPLYKEY